MKRLKVLFVALAALCALASMVAASASASVGPTLLFTNSGEPGPTVLLNIKPETVETTGLQSTAASITGKKLSLEITLLAENGVLEGIYLAKFYETAKSGTGECHTAGAAKAGEIEVGEGGKSEIIKVVYIKIGSPLEVGEVFQVADLTVLCGMGPLEVLIKGSVLGTIEPLNTKIKPGKNEIKGGLRCSSTTGVPAITKDITSTGAEGVTELKTSAGGTNSKGCELIGTTATSVVNLLPTKEIELMG